MAEGTISEQIYRNELAPWLPPRIFDCHVHVSLGEHWGPISAERLAELWAIEAGDRLSWKELRDNYRKLFPGRPVVALVFGNVFREVDIEGNNEYVLSGLGDPTNHALGLFVTRPEWSASRIESALARGFVGIKPYPDLAPPGRESVFDCLPKAHLEVLNRLGGVLMLHLPRKGRIGDPDNIREILEIADTYPAIRFIVAHIGRAYCLPAAKKGLPLLADRPQIHFDTAANLNADVFQYALETVGPERILFGSDLPVTLMRGVREHAGESYVNYTDGPYSWNTNRKGPEEEAHYTYYLYEELRALIKAVQRTGLGSEAMARIMYSNSARLLGIATGG